MQNSSATMASNVAFQRTLSVINDELKKGQEFDDILIECLPLFQSKVVRRKALRKFSPRRLLSRQEWLLLLSVVVAGLAYWIYDSGLDYWDDLIKEQCLLDHEQVNGELTRPLYDCNLCKDLTSIPTVSNITSEEFLHKYAYSSVPLLVTGVAKEWKALDTFSFKFFLRLYARNKKALKFKASEGCQFFTYDGQFDHLKDVFLMPPERVNMSVGHWYVGWSTCNADIQSELMTLYSTPHFIPEDATTGTDLHWIFMGGQGQGAPIHIDDVDFPSWQAQISGRKTWYLFPAPECDSVCQPLEATMDVGDIILVDTNKWFHSTFVHPGNLSITIGTEYD